MNVFPLWYLKSTVGAVVDRTQGAFLFPDNGPSAFTQAIGPEVALVVFSTERGGEVFSARLGISNVAVELLSSPRELRDMASRFKGHCTLLLIDPGTSQQRGIKFLDILGSPAEAVEEE